ncbi:MAG: helix-turn-helix domain-containing protein [Trueperaceae bacterium]
MLRCFQHMQDTLQSETRPETFHLWVKRWRAYLGVTQKEFAGLWGVSASMVQKIETQDYSVGQLSFERLEDLRALLKLSPAEFYGILTGEEEPL